MKDIALGIVQNKTDPAELPDKLETILRLGMEESAKHTKASSNTEIKGFKDLEGPDLALRTAILSHCNTVRDLELHLH